MAGESSRSFSRLASFTDWNVDASSASFDFGLYILLLSPLLDAKIMANGLLLLSQWVFYYPAL